jgi:hypothetical protein
MFVEATFLEARLGASVLSFDGRVIECFRSDAGDGWRKHLALVTLGRIDGPDKKGRYDVAFAFRGDGSEVVRLIVEGDQYARLHPVLEAIRAAG